MAFQTQKFEAIYNSDKLDTCLAKLSLNQPENRILDQNETNIEEVIKLSARANSDAIHSLALVLDQTIGVGDKFVVGGEVDQGKGEITAHIKSVVEKNELINKQLYRNLDDFRQQKSSANATKKNFTSCTTSDIQC